MPSIASESIPSQLPAVSESELPRGSTLRQTLILVCMSFFITSLVSPKGLAKLPLRYLLKNDLHLDAVVMASFFAIGWLAWYFKPLAGLIADSVRFRGTRRRHYLLGSAILGIVLWIALPFASSRYSTFLGVITLLNIALMMLSTVLGGLMVEEGRRHGATGRVSVARSASSSVADLVSGPAGGLLAERAFGWAAGLSAALLALLTLVFYGNVREPKVVPESANRDLIGIGRSFAQQVRTLCGSKPLWAATAMIFFIYVSPGLYTPLFYYQTDNLHFSSVFIGNLGIISGGMAIAGSLLYAWLCRRLSLRTLLAVGIVAGSIGEGLYLGYRSHASAIVIEGLNGLGSTLVTLAVFDLAARGTPRGCESLGYSLIMALNNLAISVSDILGSWMYSNLHWSFHSIVWVNATTTVITLIAVPFLPHVLMSRRDGDSPEKEN